MAGNNTKRDQEVLVLEGGRFKIGGPRARFVPPVEWVLSSAELFRELLTRAIEAAKETA